MPAEWEPHAATWFTWPRRDGVSYPEIYEKIPPIYADLTRQLVQHEEVNFCVWDEAMAAEIRSTFKELGVPMDNVRLHQFQSYECWTRDHGPIFITRDFKGTHERAVIDWRYNAWGGKYPPWDKDDEIPRHVAEHRDLPCFEPAMILEGGSIDVNGAGTLMTTESCLLNPNRNTHMEKKEIVWHLKEFLGIENILWLGEGIVGDDTDGHVDDISRFVNPTTIVTAHEDDVNDANFEPLRENYQRLRMMRDQDDKLFRVVKLPMPGIVEMFGQRLPASYANFYIANNLVLVPTYKHGNDRRALEILQKEFPDRKVVGIDATQLIWGLGSFHCISMQEPA